MTILREGKTASQSAQTKYETLLNWLAAPIVPFGKYRGYRCSQIVRLDPRYARWVILKVKDNAEIVSSMKKEFRQLIEEN